MDDPGMKTIEWRLSIGLVGCSRKGKIQVEADCDLAEIDDMVREIVMDEIEWTWNEQEPPR